MSFRKTAAALVVVGLSMGFLSGCASRTIRNSDASFDVANSAPRQTLIQSVSDSTRVPLRVGPGPLPPELDDVVYVRDQSRSSSTESRVASAGSLVAVGLRSADQPIREACAGRMLPFSPDSLHRGCPMSPQALVVIGKPRLTAGPCAQNEASSERKLGFACASVRAVITSVDRHGFSISVFDYQFERAGDEHWRLVRRTSVGFVE